MTITNERELQQLYSIRLRVLTTALISLKSLISERLLLNKADYDCNWPHLVVPGDPSLLK